MSSRPPAQPSPDRYKRHLPHIVTGEHPLFVTFCTRGRWVIPEALRMQLLLHCLHDHAVKLWVHAVIVMPDHVHMILSLLRDEQAAFYGLAEIMSGIKGASAHSINKALGRKGPVWQDESFDHFLRCEESISAKAQYLWENPVRKKLVAIPEQWPWFWADWMPRPGPGQ